MRRVIRERNIQQLAHKYFAYALMSKKRDALVLYVGVDLVKSKLAVVLKTESGNPAVKLGADAAAGIAQLELRKLGMLVPSVTHASDSAACKYF